MIKKSAFISSVVLTVVAMGAEAYAQPTPNYAGTWTTVYENQGTGTANREMTVTQRDNILVFSYAEGSMTCQLSGNTCSGLWQGTGSGGFRIRFNSSGNMFSGRWWYANDASNRLSFSGHR